MQAATASGEDESEIGRRPMRMAVATLLIVLGAVVLFVLSTVQAVRIIDARAVEEQRAVVGKLLADPQLTTGFSPEQIVSRIAGLAALADARFVVDVPIAATDQVAVPLPGPGAGYLLWTPHRVASETLGQVAPMRLVIIGLLVPLLGIVLWRFRGFVLDLDRERRAARRLAARDSLTGLANRMEFESRLGHELEHAIHTDAGAALMLIDLNGFKQVNDWHGHAAGDAVLVEVAERLRRSIGPNTVVARLGGDEFAVIMPLEGASDPVFRLAFDIHAALAQPHRIGDRLVEASGSIGIALSPEHGIDGDELLGCADAALYAAKARPDRPFLMFEPRPRVAA